MSAQRMLRSGPLAEVIKSPAGRPEDARQGALDFDPDASSAERMIFRLAYENAQQPTRLRLAGLPTSIDDPIPAAAEGSHGRNSEPDPIAVLAASFAAQVVQLASIQGDKADDQDAERVNTSIEMIAEDADALVAAVIKDAEDHGLEASGPRLKIPLIEAQAFEVPVPDPATDEADEAQDRRLNA